MRVSSNFSFNFSWVPYKESTLVVCLHIRIFCMKVLVGNSNLRSPEIKKLLYFENVNLPKI